MKKHRARAKQARQTHFKRKKSHSEESLRTLVKDSIHYMNLFADQAPTMYLCGNRSLYIEHYENIVEYTGGRLKIQLKGMRLVLEGEDIRLEYFSKDDLKVRGNIEKMLFISQNEGV